MELPIKLREMIENQFKNTSIKDLQKCVNDMSLKYKNESGAGKRLVTKEIEAMVYSAVRMPATYSAIYTALEKTFEIYDCKIDSVLDIGAGTGSGSWAVNNLKEVKTITCLEREEVMRNLGKKFMQESDIDVLQKAIWQEIDLRNSEINYSADLVICSYVLNELSEEQRFNVLKRLWNATEKVLIIIEPGTPVGFKEIKELREKLISYGGKIIAPCPNINICPILDNDWCHTTCRLSRTKIHKLLKNGDVPYEDEKFSYVSVCKENFEKNDCVRILRHPKIEPGKITLQVCSKDGIYEKCVFKKEKELFKKARKLKCGDALM